MPPSPTVIGPIPGFVAPFAAIWAAERQNVVGTARVKVAVEAALGRRGRIDVFGSDYDTPDGTCIRDFIHVSDLARAHRAALNYLRSGAKSVTLDFRPVHTYTMTNEMQYIEPKARVY